MEIKIVTLDNFYACAEIPEAQHYFMGMLLLRMHGFGPDYPKSFLPLDTADYVCWHHLICVKNGNNWLPIAGYRQISLERCDFYHLPIPLLKFAEEAKAERHLNIMRGLIDQHRRDGSNLVYGSAITIDKKYRDRASFSNLFGELASALHYTDMIEHQVKTTLCGAALAFKINILFERNGFIPLEFDGKALPPIPNRAANDQPLLLMTASDFTAWSKTCYEKHKYLLDSRLRLFLGDPSNQESAA